MAKKKQPAAVPPELVQGDCVQGLASRPPGFANLVVADPPYNFGMQYHACDDAKPPENYLAWSQRWLAAAAQAMHRHGSLFLFIPDEWAADLDVYIRRSLGLWRRNWIIWTYTFGQAAQKRFTRSHTHILYYVKTKGRFTFNAEAIRVPSARQLVYNDRRAEPRGKLPDDTWALLRQDLARTLPEGGDVWLESRVCGTFHARRDHVPNQLPLPLLLRIVSAASNPGDTVVDPFLGTGTTAVACQRLNRRFVGFDLDARCLAACRERLARGDGGDDRQLPLFPEAAVTGA